ncbi:MAG: hypothetical protein RR595_13755 [Lysinibacillus sp.]
MKQRFAVGDIVKVEDVSEMKYQRRNFIEGKEYEVVAIKPDGWIQILNNNKKQGYGPNETAFFVLVKRAE